jgi:hypothetical protein
VKWRNLAGFALLWSALILLVGTLATGLYTFADDLRAYWSAWGGGLYGNGATLGQLTFLYSPAFAQAFWPFTLLSWPLMRLLWAALTLGAYAWLTWPLPLHLRLPAMGIACCSALIGNLDWVVALVAVLGMRYPAAWVILLLSRVTPGISLLWFVVRREWGSLLMVAGTTAAVVGLSLVLAPALWADWLGVLVRSSHGGKDGYWLCIGMPPLPLRLILAAVIVSAGAWRDWRPAIAVAALLASPDLWPWTPAILLAMPRLARRGDVAEASLRAGRGRLADVGSETRRSGGSTVAPSIQMATPYSPAAEATVSPPIARP